MTLGKQHASPDDFVMTLKPLLHFFVCGNIFLNVSRRIWETVGRPQVNLLICATYGPAVLTVVILDGGQGTRVPVWTKIEPLLHRRRTDVEH